MYFNHCEEIDGWCSSVRRCSISDQAHYHCPYCEQSNRAGELEAHVRYKHDKKPKVIRSGVAYEGGTNEKVPGS